MIRAYIAGPYSAHDREGVEINVQAGIRAWHMLRDLGLDPFLPHLAHYLEAWQRRPYEDWLEWDMGWLESCDVLVRLDGPSPGADREVAKAEELGLTVYTLDEALEEFGRCHA